MSAVSSHITAAPMDENANVSSKRTDLAGSRNMKPQLSQRPVKPRRALGTLSSSQVNARQQEKIKSSKSSVSEVTKFQIRTPSKQQQLYDDSIDNMICSGLSNKADPADSIDKMASRIKYRTKVEPCVGTVKYPIVLSRSKSQRNNSENGGATDFVSDGICFDSPGNTEENTQEHTSSLSEQLMSDQELFALLDD